MNLFEEKFLKFVNEFGKAKTMVLATSYKDNVTARMVSVVFIKNKFYFQTDKNFRKYKQIIKNPNVSLCIDNIQIDGLCQEIGRPSEHQKFSAAYKTHFSGSYQKYTHLEIERLFEISPKYIKRWHYIDGVPFIESFDFETKNYNMEEYIIGRE